MYIFIYTYIRIYIYIHIYIYVYIYGVWGYVNGDAVADAVVLARVLRVLLLPSIEDAVLLLGKHLRFGFGFRISGFRFRVWGLGIWVPGFGLRVPGSCRVQGEGCRV